MAEHTFTSLATNYFTKTNSTPTSEETSTVNPSSIGHLPSGYSIIHIALSISIVSLLTVFIVFGNCLVIAAILKDRHLQQIQHWFLISLAVSDCLLGVLIIPLSLMYELLGYWPLGSILCELWLAVDVLLCTASILNLCAISLDRYWSVTRTAYSIERTRRRIGLMILAVWSLSAAICVPPLFGWKTLLPEEEYPKCHLSNDLGYVLYSSAGSFWIPSLVLWGLYIRIYHIAKQRATGSIWQKQLITPNYTKDKPSFRRLFKAKENTTGCEKNGRYVDKSDRSPKRDFMDTSCHVPCLHLKDKSPDLSKQDIEMVAFSSSEQTQDLVRSKPEIACDEIQPLRQKNISECQFFPSTPGSSFPTLVKPNSAQQLNQTSPPTPKTPLICEVGKQKQAELSRKKYRLGKQRERRAVIVVTLIIAAFMSCWTPFFTLYVVQVFHDVPPMLFAVFFWFGYCNSALNPLIYTIFNLEFRRAFKKILKCCFKPDSYTDQSLRSLERGSSH